MQLGIQKEREREREREENISIFKENLSYSGRIKMVHFQWDKARLGSSEIV